MLRLTLVLSLFVASCWGNDAGTTTDQITLVLGKGAIIDCPDGISKVSTSSPEVVDAVAASEREVLFNAKGAGDATLVIWSRKGSRRVYAVTVLPNLEPMRRLLRDTFPDEELDVRAAKDSVALIGNASTQAVADRALALVTVSVKGAVSNVRVAPVPVEKQILLKVKFAEVNRSATSALGVNILSTGAGNTIARITTGQFTPPSLSQVTGQIPGRNEGTTTTFSLSDALNIFAFRPDLDLGVLIKALQEQGLLQILAEPNLVAINGKEANFLAGGEFPVPIVQAGASSGAVTVQFREFGIRLSFIPQVTPNGTIRMHVKPEVSSIDSGNGIVVSGFNIPALTTRRMETDIELNEGQSFAIAGLIDDRVIQNLSQVPGLAHIPVLGALFRSRSEKKTKTELIVVVTPEVAAASTSQPKLPRMPRPFLDTPVTKEGQ